MSPSLTLVEQYVETHPAEVARQLERAQPDEAAAVVSSLQPAYGAELLSELAPGPAADVVAVLPADAIDRLGERISPDDWASWLRRCRSDAATRVLASLPAATADSVQVLMRHAPDTVGAAMDPAVPALPLTLTVGEARALLAKHTTGIPVAFAVDDARQLVGRIDVERLMTAPGDAPLETTVVRHTPWLAAGALLSSVATHPAWRDVDALPVASENQRVVGALSHRRLRQRLDHQAPADGDERVARTVIALGEIYWLGLCGLLQGIAETATEPARTGSES